jgi:hypothetical protein
VILTVTSLNATNNFNVNVTNLSVVENNPTEAPTSVINDQVTPITYGDNFSIVSYNRNDGIAGFATAWDESDDDDSANSGKIQINGNQLRFNNNGGGTGPSIMRTINFASYTVDAQPVLTFNYSIANSPSGSPNFVVESSDNGSSWTTIWSTTASSGSGTSGNVNIPAPWTGTKYIRYRIASGYSGNATQYMFIDNVLVSTETHDCAAAVKASSATCRRWAASCLTTSLSARR